MTPLYIRAHAPPPVLRTHTPGDAPRTPASEPRSVFRLFRGCKTLLDRARDLIIHGSAHRGANGVAMPTDEDDQDGHFFYNHPERGAYFAA